MVSRPSDSAIWVATSRLRAENQRSRLRESSPICSLSSGTTLVRDSFHAGPRPNTMRAQHAEGQRRGHHANVGGPVEGERHRRERQQRRHQQVDAPVAEQQAERAADERQHHPLGQQLPHDPAAAAAERQAHRDFLAAGRCRGPASCWPGSGTHTTSTITAIADQHAERCRPVAVGLRAGRDRHARQLLRREQLVLVLGRVGPLELRGQSA